MGVFLLLLIVCSVLMKCCCLPLFWESVNIIDDRPLQARLSGGDDRLALLVDGDPLSSLVHIFSSDAVAGVRQFGAAGRPWLPERDVSRPVPVFQNNEAPPVALAVANWTQPSRTWGAFVACIRLGVGLDGKYELALAGLVGTLFTPTEVTAELGDLPFLGSQIAIATCQTLGCRRGIENEYISLALWVNGAMLYFYAGILPLLRVGSGVAKLHPVAPPVPVASAGPDPGLIVLFESATLGTLVLWDSGVSLLMVRAPLTAHIWGVAEEVASGGLLATGTRVGDRMMVAHYDRSDGGALVVSQLVDGWNWQHWRTPVDRPPALLQLTSVGLRGSLVSGRTPVAVWYDGVDSVRVALPTVSPGTSAVVERGVPDVKPAHPVLSTHGDWLLYSGLMGHRLTLANLVTFFDENPPPLSAPPTAVPTAAPPSSTMGFSTTEERGSAASAVISAATDDGTSAAAGSSDAAPAPFVLGLQASLVLAGAGVCVVLTVLAGAVLMCRMTRRRRRHQSEHRSRSVTAASRLKQTHRSRRSSTATGMRATRARTGTRSLQPPPSASPSSSSSGQQQYVSIQQQGWQQQRQPQGYERADLGPLAAPSNYELIQDIRSKPTHYQSGSNYTQK